MHEEGWMSVFLTYIFNSFDCPVFIAHHFIKIISSLENSNSTAKSKLNFETHYFRKRGCVVPENIHTSPTKGFFFLRTPPPPPLWTSQQSFTHFFKFLGLTEPPTPQEIPLPSVGGVWIFSGCAQCKNPNGIGKLVDFGVSDMKDASVTVTKGKSSLTNYYCKLYTVHK